MRRGVDRVVEALVRVEVGLGVALIDGAVACRVRLLDGSQLVLGHAPRGELGAHHLQLGHDLEHLDQALGRDAHDDHAAARAGLDETFAEQQVERLTDRRSRHVVALRELDFVQARARQQLPGGDLLLDGFAKAL